MSSRNDDPPIRENKVIQALSVEVGEETIPFLLERFVLDLETHLPVVIEAARAGDATPLERESHTLKSVSGTFGALRLQQLMTRINECCRLGDFKEALIHAGRVEAVGKLTLEAFQSE
ncbi:Hpt domain-containing protein [Kiloniella laminariae]|uniref:Hpt domain-containing protein n=1 Tax=Kiloniella laminariae TaxID=454162 RepID=UPI0003712ABF|nr:Hpt domain-containing protein [Kiloniella laminariae]